MEIEIIRTKDGSHTLYTPRFDEVYHSRNGAMSESRHIFINSGLEAFHQDEINVFELGFGTGLNAFLSWIYAASKEVRINYHGVELYPLSDDVISKINYPEMIPDHENKFKRLHEADWEKEIPLSPNFTLHKIKGSVLDLSLPSQSIDVVFFDAFSPDKQPELWTMEVFKKVYDMLDPGGALVTYCSKSAVRKNMQEAGLFVTKLQGPPGKRDMVRAFRPAD